MARRKKHEEHVNHERWLVSYADFITLLFAFFVVMYSISSVNEGKYRVLSDTLEAVFSDTPRSMEPIQAGDIRRGHGEQSPDPGTLKADQPPNALELPVIETYTPPPVSEDVIQTIDDISKQFNSALADMIENEDVSIKQGEDWLELEIKSNVLFESGESRLENTAVPVVGKIATILNTSANPIQVEGFTDNNPINTPKFPSNWELSAARAASVVHLLNRYGVEPSRMSAIGYGEFKPIADNATEQGRQKNRRVVLVVLGSQDSRRDIDVFSDEKVSPDNTTSSLPPSSPTIDDNVDIVTPLAGETSP
ncbi:MAG: flagellar motor protein MotD [Gammaproteobacteria bacterium]|nr:flagellar motor protein MotD [Gammaproteobacteria bacterium]